MDYINYNKNYITDIIKRNNFTLTKDRLNEIFNIFTGHLNDLKQAIIETNNLIFQSSGNINTYFVNIGDGTVEQRTIRDIVSGLDGFQLAKILSPAIDETSIMQINNDSNVRFTFLRNNSIIKTSDSSIIFDLLKKEDIENQQFESSIFKNNTITFDLFKNSQHQIFVDNTKFTKKNLSANFKFKFEKPDYSWDGSDRLFYYSRKSMDWITPLGNQCDDTKLDKVLHLMITPKAIANNVVLNEQLYGDNTNPFLLSPFWSVGIKTKNKKMHYASSRFSRGLRPDRVTNRSTDIHNSNTRDIVYSIQDTTKLFNDIRAGKAKTIYNTSIDGLEIEDCGTFEDNLFTNDMFVSFTDIYANWYPSYIGPMYIKKKYLNPTFKINKRICYESIYADYTKNHGRPALQKENVPDVIVNRLRTHYGVVDSDWDYEGVYN